MLGLSANKFEEEQAASNRNISSMFASAAARRSSGSQCATASQRPPSPFSSQLPPSSSDFTASSQGFWTVSDCHGVESNSFASQSLFTQSTQVTNSLASQSLFTQATRLESSEGSSNHTVSDKSCELQETAQNFSSASQKKNSDSSSGGKRNSLDFFFGNSQKLRPTETATCNSDFSVALHRDCEPGLKKKGFFASRQEQLHHKHHEASVSTMKDSNGHCAVINEATSSSVASEQTLEDGEDDTSSENDVQFVDSESNSGLDTDRKDSSSFRFNSANQMQDSKKIGEESQNSCSETSNFLQETVTSGSVDSLHHVSHDLEEGSNQSEPNREERHHSSKLADEDLMTCDKCGQTLPVWEMPEHSDFHFAMELQQTSDPFPMTSGARDSTSSSAVVGGAKRKLSPSGRGGRGGKRGRPKKEVVVQRSNLLSFFSKE